MNRNSKLQDVRRLAALGHAICLALAVLPGCHHKSLLSDPEIIKQTVGDGKESETLVFQAGNWETPAAAAPGTPQGDLMVAETLFRKEDYAKAAKVFEEVAEKHKNVSDVHERALFMKGECEYQEGHLAQARDDFEEFLKAFPGSRHLSAAMQRLFAIADTWLEDARQDIRQGHPAAFPRRFISLDRNRKPLFDIDGHAIHTLDYVREHDPNGPLADDSLMMEAGYHFSLGDYREADQFYDQLIHNYPHSDYQAQAHMLSAESKIQSYKGSSYDGRKMEEARRILQATVTQFPDQVESDRPRIYRELDEIRQEQAKKEFEIAEWYRRMGKTNPERLKSARLYYQYVIRSFPGTKWAERAETRLKEIGPASPAESSKEQAKADDSKAK